MGNISKFLSLILRHKPEEVGITLDSKGYADVEELLRGINSSGRFIDKAMLESIVVNDNKGRYSFNADKTKIRANQGHSIKVDVELCEVNPPEVLYHGTATRFVDSILRDGLKSMSRLYVHLSSDIETAIKVGKRHGRVLVFEVDTRRMSEDGIKFYLSKNGVWLVDFVDSKYLKEVKF